MTRSPACSALSLSLGLVGLVAAAGCSDDAPAGNPATLWLALDGSEVQVRLVPVEPPPF
jgi:hypothetical protein